MRTRVGYAGGTKSAPTYRDLGDHTEALQVDFDPAVTGFGELLEVFWQEHDPCRRPWSTQYKAILFHDGEEQRRLAAASAAGAAARLGRPVTTELVALGRFWPAEDYHQKHALRGQRALAAQVLAQLGSEAAFRDDPATAKLNAFCAGQLTRPALEAALRPLGWRPLGEAGAVTGIERLEPAQAPPPPAAARR